MNRSKATFHRPHIDIKSLLDLSLMEINQLYRLAILHCHNVNARGGMMSIAFFRSLCACPPLGPPLMPD